MLRLRQRDLAGPHPRPINHPDMLMRGRNAMNIQEPRCDQRARPLARGWRAFPERFDLQTALLPRLPQRGHFGVLGLMGLLDALALGFVTASGGLPRAEYASVASSLFGVLTVLLAAWFLKEHVRRVQWVGIACVFGGIAGLGLLGG